LSKDVYLDLSNEAYGNYIIIITIVAAAFLSLSQNNILHGNMYRASRRVCGKRAI
jgi:hypothetical protein